MSQWKKTVETLMAEFSYIWINFFSLAYSCIFLFRLQYNTTV